MSPAQTERLALQAAVACISLTPDKRAGSHRCYDCGYATKHDWELAEIVQARPSLAPFLETDIVLKEVVQDRIHIKNDLPAVATCSCGTTGWFPENSVKKYPKMRLDDVLPMIHEELQDRSKYHPTP